MFEAEEAFDEAVTEPKITKREQVIVRNSQPLAPVSTSFKKDIDPVVIAANQDKSSVVEKKTEGAREVLRKHMTLAIDEALTEIPNLVYIGEDVVHGGYYLVTGLLISYSILVCC